MKQKCKALAWVALYIGIVFAVQFLIMLMFGMAAGMLAGSMGLSVTSDGMSRFMDSVIRYISQSAQLMQLNALIELVLLACFGWWYYFRENRYPFRPDYKKAFTGKNILSIAGIGFLGQYAITPILMLLYFLAPKAFESYAKLTENFELTGSPVLIAVTVCILGPVAEELIFRGMIYGKLRRAFSMMLAILISGILFGIYHMNLIQGVYAAVFGFVLAYIYEKTQTIWGSILLHIVFNTSSYVITGCEGLLEKAGLSMPMWLELLIMLISIVVVILLLRVFRTKKAAVCPDGLSGEQREEQG